MANPRKRLTANADGDFYVDESCIDCGACRWIAPASFAEGDDVSYVFHQPEDPAEESAALRAIVSCPTGSIGAARGYDIKGAADSFPFELMDGVYHCGFHSEKSFGAASYLITRPDGNVLVDSPRFSRRLARKLEALGGVALMFLTHQDDVADHDRFRDHFGCERIMHSADLSASTRGMERQLVGRAPVALANDLLAIPVPGHTRGSMCLLHDERHLFSGDHVAWSRTMERVYAFSGACWFDWDEQIESMERLAEHRFEHILPGHSAPCSFPAEDMNRHILDCVTWMRGRR